MRTYLVVILRLVGPDRYGNFDYEEHYDYEVDYEDEDYEDDDPCDCDDDGAA